VRGSLAEKLAKAGAGFVQTGLDGADGHAEDGGGLFVREFLNLDQHERGGRFGRKARQGGPETLAVEHRVDRRVGAPPTRIERDPHPPCASPVQELAVGDAVEPRSETRTAVERARASKGADQGALRKILRVLRVAGEAAQKTVEIVEVVLDEPVGRERGQRVHGLSKGIETRSASGVRSVFETYTQRQTMPVFEYRCAVCGRKFSALVGMTAEPDDSRCPQCGSLDVAKLVSRPGRYRVEDDRIDEIADRLEAMGEPDSPAAMRATMREVGKALDDDASEEMEAMFEADMADAASDVSGPEV
jgi:putative FmdB family regulatory protein